MKKIASLFFLFIYACAPAVTALPTAAPTSTPQPTNTPDPLLPVVTALQEKGIGVTATGLENGALALTIDGGQNPIPNAFFDESGEFLHVQGVDGAEIKIPVEDAVDRLELTENGILIVNGEDGKPQAIFDAQRAEKGWLFPNKEVGVELDKDVFEDGDGNQWVLDGDRLIDADTYSLFAEHGFDTSSVDFETGEDGVVRGYFAGEEGNEWLEPGKLIYEDGKFDIPWAVLNLYNEGDNDLFSTYDLESGPIEPGHSSGVSLKDYNRYFLPLYLEKEEIFKPHIKSNVPGLAGLAAFQVIIDPDKLAWGQILYVYDPETKKPGPLHFIMYEKADGKLIVMEAIANMDREQIIVFNEEQDSWAKDQLSDDQ